MKTKKLTARQQDALDARLRSDGEDEMRRRWRAGERALEGEGRPYFIREVEKWADDDRPERQRWLRENLGDREAEFRQGIAQEARQLLRRLQPSPSAAKLAQEKRDAEAWARKKIVQGDRIRCDNNGPYFNERGVVEYVRKDGDLIIQFEKDPPNHIVVMGPSGLRKV